MNEHAIKIADDELYKRHPELVDAAGNRRPLTMGAADTAYRKEWMKYYKAVDKADKEQFGECPVDNVVRPCPPPPVEKWDQLEVLKILCNPEDRWAIDVLKHPDAKTFRSDRILYVDKKFRLDRQGRPVGNPIAVNVFPGGGSNNPDERRINLLSGGDPLEVAATIVHEARHQVQDRTTLDTWKKQEIDAYTAEEQFRIRNGMPAHAEGFRRTLPDGSIVPNPAAISAYVNREYPVQPGWFPGGEIDEGKEDVSAGWDCSRVGK